MGLEVVGGGVALEAGIAESVAVVTDPEMRRPVELGALIAREDVVEVGSDLDSSVTAEVGVDGRREVVLERGSRGTPTAAHIDARLWRWAFVTWS